MTEKKLEREVFTIARELEYFAESELTAQTGCPKELWWPEVVFKELVDNALDVCEGNVAPIITIQIGKRSIEVGDNGPGIKAHVVRRVLDYSTRTSAKRAYVSPMRGAQGNALKTVFAIPYVLDGKKKATIEIMAQGVKHLISVSTDAIGQRPQITHETSKIVKIAGTRIRLTRNSACLENEGQTLQNLQKLVRDYSLFNPHATFVLNGQRFEATNPGWKKWLPTDPTSAHWYDADRFEYLVASYIAAERRGTRPRTVRDLVSEFRNLSATSKQTNVSEVSGLARARLADLVQNGTIDRVVLGRLLKAMQKNSNPVKPEGLGVLGEKHFRELIAAEGETFHYSRKKGFDTTNLPYVVEAVFAIVRFNSPWRGLHTGVNWSVPLVEPLQQVELGNEQGLSALLEQAHIDVDYDSDPVCLILHLSSPRFTFLDRGKGSLMVSERFADSIKEAISKVTNEWSKIKTREYRRQQKDEQARDRLLRSRSSRVSEKAAAFEAIPAAYAKASAGKPFAEARQVMYAARPTMLARTGKSTIDDERFTQKLLPQYIREHPEQTKHWNVVYDDRGHLIEPHTGTIIGIGTINVADYLHKAETSTGLDFEPPTFTALIPSKGPKHRYGGLLFIEKEGLIPLLQLEKVGERYDLAIASSKGLASTAARNLLEALTVDHKVRIFVVHDFDKSGFSIFGTLTRDTERHQFTRDFQVIDLGLRLADIKKLGLEGEPVPYPSEPTANLLENGATHEEVQFLLNDSKYEYDDRGKRKLVSGMGQRVELNELPNDRFLAWLEGKLVKHKVDKVTPEAAVLEQAYRRDMMAELSRQLIAESWQGMKQQVKAMRAPANLSLELAACLKSKPELPWDLAMHEVLFKRDGGR
jgi:DNA topoisomerase VI subunit B